MTRAARRLFLSDGTVVTSTDQLSNGAEVAVSAGEAFVKTRKPLVQMNHEPSHNEPSAVVESPKLPKPTKQMLLAAKQAYTRAAVRVLCDTVSIEGSVMDCCGAFDGPVAASLIVKGRQVHHTNDINANTYASTHEDATDPNAELWTSAAFQWIVTKPPPWLAADILPLAYEAAEVGVAMLADLDLLLSGSEWIAQTPPAIIALPRQLGPGQRGQSGLVWLLWDKECHYPNTVISKKSFLLEMDLAV